MPKKTPRRKMDPGASNLPLDPRAPKKKPKNLPLPIGKQPKRKKKSSKR